MKFIVTKELGRFAKWPRIDEFDKIYRQADKVSQIDSGPIKYLFSQRK